MEASRGIESKTPGWEPDAFEHLATNRSSLGTFRSALQVLIQKSVAFLLVACLSSCGSQFQASGLLGYRYSIPEWFFFIN